VEGLLPIKEQDLYRGLTQFLFIESVAQYRIPTLYPFPTRLEQRRHGLGQIEQHGTRRGGICRSDKLAVSMLDTAEVGGLPGWPESRGTISNRNAQTRQFCVEHWGQRCK